jgi:hypothetical protein
MILAVLTLVIFTAPGGLHVAVNPEEVVSLRSRALGGDNTEIRCTINLTDGKNLGVIEECATVYRQLNGK